MAAAHVLHVGSDLLHRTLVLRTAGYAVDECGTLPEMAAWFLEGHRTDVVCISEEPHRPAEGAIVLARTYSIAPVVLFRSADHTYLQKSWDLDFPPLTRPEVWLNDLAQLLAATRANIAKSAELRASSQQLRMGSEAVRRQSQDLRVRVRQQLEKWRRPGK